MAKWIFIFFFMTHLFGDLSFHQEGPNSIGHIRLEIDRPIDASTYLYVKFALQHFRKEKVSFIVLELNTPGGEVFAAQKIARLLYESDALHGIPVVAYLNNWALSAGAMLAYSCRYIAASPSASMGAAEPVMMKADGMESAPEKIKSALRAEFANTAALFGRDPALAEAMVDKDLTLVRRGGKFVIVDGDVLKEDELISAKGKLLTLNAKELEQFGLSQFQVPASGKGLFAIAPFSDIPQAKLLEYSDWKIGFFSILLHPAVASLLTLGLMFGLYLEANAPGHGTGALIAGTCLGFILLSHFADSAVQWLEILSIALGAALILLEIIAFPTAGILLFLGGAFLLGGLFALGLPDMGPVQFSFDMSQWNLAAFAFYRALGWFSASVCGAALLVWFVARKGSSLFDQLILKHETSPLPVFKLPLVGALGEAQIPCRPWGQILVEGEVFEAFAETGFIDKGEQVRIVGIDSGRLLIRKRE